ncbi:unnamed protein product [Adineta steineri]|uniref:Tudor domain-containing protein n=1 Tax=Adineta steineri TaxID=433720 RepID=A0A814DRS2_9BILA|nr:unnamed protein product [Adineta steineri]
MAKANPTKYRQGTLTYFDKINPVVYLQLSPDSVSTMERINELIDNAVQENNHNSSYEIGDHIIAQFADDGSYYRARIESYSDTAKTYAVYFLDYGNLDENVPVDHLFSYPDELKQIEAQAHKYSLENQTSQTWTKSVLPLIEEKQNETIDFYFINENQSIIRIKFSENDNQIYNNQPRTLNANISGTNKDCFYIHILPDSDTLICEMCELLETYKGEHQTSNQWNINDLCIVFDNEQEKYFRGKILSINNENYDVQCIDYGNILVNKSNDDIYLLNNDELLKQSPLAQKCRLYGVKEENQKKAIEEIIKNITPTENVTITVQNDQDNSCMLVMLFRNNNEIVNDLYQSDNDNQKETDTEKKHETLPISFDSAIAADDYMSNAETPFTVNDQQLTSPIGIPQANSTQQYSDTANATVNNSSPSTTSMTIDGTIDFGENDPSTTNTTIKDDTQNESVS